MLYLRKTHTEASPKAISRRTSYLRVRLEFLPYPHLIPTLFNGCGFGPPLPLTAASTWTCLLYTSGSSPEKDWALLHLHPPENPFPCLWGPGSPVLWLPEEVPVEALYMCDRVLFVERSGELRLLARLSTSGVEP